MEKPAHLSTEFNFFIFIESTDAADDQFVASVSLPIHLRYQQPQMNGDRKSSVLPNPVVAVRCGMSQLNIMIESHSVSS